MASWSFGIGYSSIRRSTRDRSPHPMTPCGRCLAGSGPTRRGSGADGPATDGPDPTSALPRSGLSCRKSFLHSRSWTSASFSLARRRCSGAGRSRAPRHGPPLVVPSRGRRAECLDQAHALVGAVARATSPSRAPALTTPPPTSDAESGPKDFAVQSFRGAAPGRSSVQRL